MGHLQLQGLQEQEEVMGHLQLQGPLQAAGLIHLLPSATCGARLLGTPAAPEHHRIAKGIDRPNEISSLDGRHGRKRSFRHLHPAAGRKGISCRSAALTVILAVVAVADQLQFQSTKYPQPRAATVGGAAVFSATAA